MTRKSKARYGMKRTYKLNPAVKALRNALFAGLALAAVAPSAQAACTFVGNTITCSGAFGATLNFGPGDVALPFDPTTITLDNTTVVNVLNGDGVDAFSLMDLTLTNDGSITVYGTAYAIDLAGIYAVSQYGDVSVTNNGAIDVRNLYGNAYGIISASAYGDASATNAGGILAASVYDATGMLAFAQYGDASANNSGDIYAYSRYNTATGVAATAPFGDVTISNEQYGAVLARSVFGDAVGISAQSFTGDVSVDNEGGITALASYDATGIAASSIYGAVDVTNSGYVIAESAYGSAIGISTSSVYSDVSVDNSGDIDATTVYGGLAAGILAQSTYGDVSITGSGGTISATNTYSSALGIIAVSYTGDVSIDTSTAIYATTAYGQAVGIYAGSGYGDVSVNSDGLVQAQVIVGGSATGILAYSYYGDVGVTGSGNISAEAYNGNATGIFAVSGSFAGPVSVDVSGDINASTYFGNAIGINAYSYAGDIYVTSAGEIDVSSTYGNAIGIKTGRFGYSVIDNSGNISADTYVGNAIGIQSDSFYGSYIYNSGDINAETTYGSARGIQALTTYDVAVVNSGDITASSYATGSAQGIRAKSSNGYASVTNSGDISASSTYTNAISILATGLYGVEIINTGDLSADTVFSIGYGIYAETRFGDAYVYNAGEISAHSYFATASGIYAKAGYNSAIVNSGDISASSNYANAYGAYAYGQLGVAAIFNSGDINVNAYSDSTGLFAKSLYDVAYINNSGDVSVSSEYGAIAAYGLYASAFQSTAVVLNYGGDISADGGYDADASAIVAVALNDVVVYNSGDLSAYSYNGDAIGIVGATTNGNVSIYNIGGDISAESVNANAYGIYARTDYGDILVASTGDMDIDANGLAVGIYATTQGNISVYNSGEMTVDSSSTTGAGVMALSQYGDIEILNAGNMTVDGYGFAVGIFADANYGNVYVANSGDLNVAAYGPAVGIETRAKYDIEVFNLGDISAISDSSFAGGIFSQTFLGDVSVYNEGNIAATSTNYAAGISAFTTFGDATVYNSGGIFVNAANSSVGIQASSKYDVFVANSGDIIAASNGPSTGIDATSYLGDITVYNFGAMDITSTYDVAIGINAVTSGYSYYYGSGDVSVVSTGDMYISGYGLAVGIYAETAVGDVFVYNSGEMTVSSSYVGAGIVAIANTGDVEVLNAGNIAVDAYLYAVGIVAGADYGDAYVANSGDFNITAAGAAIGIQADAEFDATVFNLGDIAVYSELSYAGGILSESYYGDAYVASQGNITATGYTYAGGILATARNGAATVFNSGTLSVYGPQGSFGIRAEAESDVFVANSGSITSTAVNGSSSGIEADSYDGEVTVYNYGAITATGYDGTTGILASSYNGDISITNGTQAITVTDTYDYGTATGIDAVSNSGDILIASNGAITANGTYAAGINANTGSYTYYAYYGYYTTNGNISVNTGTTSNIKANGVYDAYGINAEAAGSVSVTNAGSILATASDGFSVGIRTVSGYGTSITNSGTIDAAGDNAWAIVTYAEGTTITNTSTGKIFGGIWTASSSQVDSLTNDGKWYVGDKDDNSLYGSFFGGGDDSIVNNATGKIYMDDSYISMGYSEGSTNSFLNNGKLYANNDNIIDMGGNGSVFTNNGASIHMEDGDVNDTLTIYGNFAGTGHIVVDASGVTMTADRLYIEGDVVTNTANVIDVKLLSGPSIATMLAGGTIDIVNVSGTSTAANFNIGIVTPPFDELYTVESSLIKDINYSGTNDLFSLGFEITGLSSTGILATSVSPAVQNLWNQGTGTLFQREGSHHPDEGATPDYKAGVWARYYGASGSVSPDARRNNFGAGGSNNFDQDGSGWEVGVSYAFNNQWAAGLLGGGSESTVKPDAGGRAEIDGSTFGGYVTWTPGNGLYADLSYRAMSFDGHGQAGQEAFGFEGDADGFNLELGYGFKSSEGLIVEPQFQYSSVSVDMDAIEYHSSDINLDDGDSSLLRLGVALRKSYATSGGSFTPYGAISYLDELDGANRYSISDGSVNGVLVGNVDTSGGSALIEAGVSGIFKGFGYSAGLNWRDGSAYDSVFGGQVSVRYDW